MTQNKMVLQGIKKMSRGEERAGKISKKERMCEDSMKTRDWGLHIHQPL